MKKVKRINGINLVRAFAAFGIVFFHFVCHSPNDTIRNFNNIQGLNLGAIFVILFFLISGFVLQYNYNNKFSLRIYFYRRWKSIFPLFYIMYIYYFIDAVLKNGSLFWGPQVWKLIFTLFGFDGYAQWLFGVSTWYLIGEWFLGAIIILYIFFPILSYLTNRYKHLWLPIYLILLIFYLFFWGNNIGQYFGYLGDPIQKLSSMIFYFYSGMLLLKFKKIILDKRIVVFISLSAFIIMTFFTFQFPDVARYYMYAMFAFVVIYSIGELIGKNKFLCLLTCKLSNISFPVFLIQHVIIISVISSFNPISIRANIFCFVFILLICIFMSSIFMIVNNHILDLNFIKNFEEKYIYKHNKNI